MRPRNTLTSRAYRYHRRPVWRIVAVDSTLFVSTFDEKWEGHNSPVYRLDAATSGAMVRGFRRMLDEFFATAQQFV